MRAYDRYLSACAPATPRRRSHRRLRRARRAPRAGAPLRDARPLRPRGAASPRAGCSAGRPASTTWNRCSGSPRGRRMGVSSARAPPCPATATTACPPRTTRSCSARRRTCTCTSSSTLIFETGPFRTADGGIDIERFKRATEAILHRVPRYRQKLHWIPGFQHAVWVDDPRFNLDFHIRHTALPKPGTRRAAQAALGAHHVAAARPPAPALGELGDRGPRGRRALRADHQDPPLHDRRRLGHGPLADPDVDLARGARVRAARRPSCRRPSPSRLRAVCATRSLARSARRSASRATCAASPRRPRTCATRSARACAPSIKMARHGHCRRTQTPLNGPVGPHRRFDWWRVPLADLKAMRHALGCTINDVVLTVVTGAVREYLMLPRRGPERPHLPRLGAGERAQRRRRRASSATASRRG